MNPKSKTRRATGQVAPLVAACLATGLAHATVADLEEEQRSNGSLLFQYGFEGDDDSTRLADGSSNSIGLTRSFGTGGMSISFEPGYGGTGQAYLPAFDQSNHQAGAGLLTGSATLSQTVTVEAVVKFGTYASAGGRTAYIIGARPDERAYFLKQAESAGQAGRLYTTLGDNNNESVDALNPYVAGDWYYVAVVADITGSNSVMTTYGANLTAGETELSVLATNSTLFQGSWSGSGTFGIGNYFNGSQEFFQGAIDSIALTNQILSSTALQDRLDLLLQPDAGVPPVAADDTIEVGVTGALAFDPLTNDSGSVDPASVSIVSGPSAGTATFDSARGFIVYKHTGSSSGTDSFTYRITNEAGSLTDDGEVTVNVSPAIRLENHTVNVPLDAPAVPVGELVIVDALPGLTFPHAVAMDSIPGSPNSLLVATVKSEIFYIPDTTVANPVRHLVLDLDDLTNYTNGRSIYSFTCAPDFATSGHVIVAYQGDKSRLPVPNSSIPHLERDGNPYSTILCDNRVSRFTLSPAHIASALNGLSSSENDAALATEWPYLNIAQQDTVHSIGDVKFGADGYLYVSFGDEGRQEANYRNTQSITRDQFSSILRIDIDPSSTNPKPNPHYAIAVGALNGSSSPNTAFTNASTQNPNFRIPADNPFVVPAKGGSWSGDFNGNDHSAVLGSVRDEIWALGFRNPFKFHLDVDTGTGEVFAFVGDNGRHDWEEFNVIRNGDNAGWAYYEGSTFNPPLSYTPSQPGGSTPHHLPLFTYDHSDSNGSAIGGVLYHGTALPQLTGRFVCGDFNSGRIWSISTDGSSVVELSDLRLPSERIVDFQTDPATGDIFVLENNTWSGGAEPKVLRITQQLSGEPEDYPQTLGELGIFADLADLSPNPGVVPYQPNLKFWSDGADKSRWFVIKNLSDTIGYSEDGNWSFPEGMIWVKQFDFDLDQSNPGTATRRLETRVFVRNAGGAYGVSYRWNEAGTEATLVENSGDDFTINYTDAGGNPATLEWHIPTRSECMTCHTPAGGHALAMNTRQFNLENTVAGQTANLIDLLSDSGYLSGFSGDTSELPRHYRPDETSVDLEARVRSYLDVNCSYCHRDGGGAPASWDGRAQLAIEDTNILYGSPIGEGSPFPEDHIIRPGDRTHSAIWNRINARDEVNGTFNGYSQMPPLATNALDPEGIALLAEWIDNHANVAPAAAGGSLGTANVSENAQVGHILGSSDAEDPDVREGVSDQSLLSYAITAGNDQGLFTIDPESGEIRLTGWIDFERQPQHVLTVEVSDNFAPNPGTLTRTVVVDLVDESSPDLTEDLNGNGIFDSWESAFGLGADDGGTDNDSDGVSAIFEFLSGGDPEVSDASTGLNMKLVGSDPESDFGMAWNVRNGFVLGADYNVRKSDDLGTWDILTPNVDYEVVSVTPVSDGVSRVLIRYISTAPRSFLRLSKP